MPELLDTPRGKTPRRTSRIINVLALLAAGLLAAAPAAVAEPSSEAISAIDAHHTQFGGEGSFLGAPLGPATDIAGGAERAYQGGVIYYSPDTGAKAMYGVILDKYKSLGGPASSLGFPINDETDAGDGVGRFNDFAEPGGAAIYWKPETGASVLKGKVLAAWRESGGVNGPFGYPRSDMTVENGVEKAAFEGPAGTEIRWSENDGTTTMPPELAAALPGFRTGSVDQAQPVPAPNPDANAPADTEGTGTESSGINRWWGIPIGLAIVAVVAGLLGMMGRRAQPTRTTPVTNRGYTSATTTRSDATAAAQSRATNVAGAHEMHRDAPRARG
ncbi:LGFP repeat-containing protein [Nocardia iowensis]|uniref:LGFP repeat-containing protein n=1 Tax=Nocardia iowensis TaxID=204891 RepID=A0ABX8S0C4_NOCIO|nr:hypothetical protein [Nocardia iowensis]QXN94035.1 hypothetical protein KV110_13815 [Nocardia iowensis]